MCLRELSPLSIIFRSRCQENNARIIMTGAEVIDISREGIFTMLKVAGPLMLVALTVGLIISLFQALTQIQEVTLSFVPKILILFISLAIFLPYIGETLHNYAQQVYDLIAHPPDRG